MTSIAAPPSPSEKSWRRSSSEIPLAEEAPPEPELDAPESANPDQMPELDVPDPQGTEEMQRPQELPQPQTQAWHRAGVSVAGAGGADARD